MTKYSFAFLAALALMACSGSSSPSAPNTSPAQIAGSWDVAVTVTGGTELARGTQYGAQFFLTQSGSQVTGGFNAGAGTGGSVLATVSGSQVSFTLTQQQPCAGTFTGTGTVARNDSTITGSYSGTDCNGTLNANWVATPF